MNIQKIEEALNMSISFADAMRSGYGVTTSNLVIEACKEAMNEITEPDNNSDVTKDSSNEAA